MSVLFDTDSGSTGSYQIANSIRLDGSNDYLTRTFASGAGQTKGTISFWCKRSKMGAQQNIFLVGNTAPAFAGVWFDASDKLNFARFATTYQCQLITSAVFRDPSAWYHVCVSWDSTLGPASTSATIEVNGITQALGTATYPSAGLDMYLFNGDGTTPHEIGWYPTSGNYLDGYIAEVYGVAGQKLAASNFGYTDASTGQWRPKKYTGTYGTNGFYLDFKDGSSTTTLGYDRSGNGNNWTLTNDGHADE